MRCRLYLIVRPESLSLPGAEDSTGLWRDRLSGVQLTELTESSPDLLISPASTDTVGQVSCQADSPPSLNGDE